MLGTCSWGTAWPSSLASHAGPTRLPGGSQRLATKQGPQACCFAPGGAGDSAATSAGKGDTTFAPTSNFLQHHPATGPSLRSLPDLHHQWLYAPSFSASSYLLGSSRHCYLGCSLSACSTLTTQQNFVSSSPKALAMRRVPCVSPCPWAFMPAGEARWSQARMW